MRARSAEGVRAVGRHPGALPVAGRLARSVDLLHLVDRFNNPAAPPRFSWDGAHGAFQGGTLNGIREQLDYLQQLGVGALWLSPVMKNCQFEESYHGYGIQDFVAIDPRLASDPEEARRNPALVEAELRALVDAAHERGIYVILDIVLNHVGDVFEYAFDDGAGSGLAPWRDDPPYAIRWRDADGHGRPDWPQLPADPPRDAAIWPQRAATQRIRAAPRQRLRPARLGSGGRRRLLHAQGAGHRLSRGHARTRRLLPGARHPDPRLPVPDRQVRRRWLPHRHAEVHRAGVRARLRQRHPRVRAEHRQEELLHVRRGLRRRGRRSPASSAATRWSPAI